PESQSWKVTLVDKETWNQADYSKGYNCRKCPVSKDFNKLITTMAGKVKRMLK
uniref:Uncharacterized protein n=1 Tax=Oryza brachyantha TaxID=4533 RepID=J3N5M9_ORYBR